MANNGSELLDQAIEDRYIRAILEYPDLLKITAGVLKEENFATSIKAKLYAAITFYWKEFETLPTVDLLEITISELYRNEQAQLVNRLAERIWKIPPPEWKWIISKIDSKIKTIQLRKALFNANEMLGAGELRNAQAALAESIRHDGLFAGKATNDLELSKSDIYELAKSEDTFCCPTRIYALDDYLKGFFRKELFVVMAPMNVGKSWAMIHFAVSALLSSKHILYLTLEMSKERVLQRILQNVSGTYTPHHADDYERTFEVWNETWDDKDEYQAKSLFDTDNVHKNVNILKRFGGMLSVKEYPSGTATIGMIEKEVLLYDITFNKLPDLIIVDGLLDIKFSGSTDLSRQRLGLTQVARELRRLATEYNAAVVTTHQANRGAISAKVVGTEHTGESIGIAQVADTGISLNQSKAENELGKMRISIMRARNQKKWRLFEIWQNLDIGQFCQASTTIQDTSEEEEEETYTKRKNIRRRRKDD